MKLNMTVIRAMITKDLVGLAPLVILALVSFVAVPVISNLDLISMGGDQGFWAMLQANIYWLAFFLSAILMISVLQVDPADSLNHDWLTRPIERQNWIVAKLLFLVLVILIPVIVSRFFINLSADMDPGLALWYAAGIESFESATLVPLFFMIALLAPSVRQFIMLGVMVFIVFLLPGWSVTQPLLAMIGIELAGDYDSLMWVQGAVLVGAGMLGSVLIYWFLYCRRQSRAAYAVFWSTVAVMFISVYPPEQLYNWDRAIALHEDMMNNPADADLDEQVIIEPARACYPAALMGSENASDQGNQLLSQAAWPESMVSDAGAGAITFASTIAYRQLLVEWQESAHAPRDVSVEWLLSPLRTRAHLRAESLAEPVALQRSSTAENRYEQISATRSDYWLVPEDLLANVESDPSTELVMDMDATLLSPSSYELPVDGERYAFPELGSCKADLDRAGNTVTVECLNRGVRPELVSAQYIGIDSSRVDNRSIATYVHDALEFFKRERYELVLESPSLVEPEAVLVTAYNTEGIVKKQIVTPGVLGNSTDICPLPGDDVNAIAQTSSWWSDKSPHETSFVTVEQGVRLEVLDWRGEIKPEAPTLILLPGLGATAHSYDDIAESLARDYNVIGITRRGVGTSSQPNRGYGIARLSQDVLQVMDILNLPSAIMVGHSFGGEELTYLGANYPERVEGLIYLDAAYDRVASNSGEDYKRQVYLDRLLPPVPAPRPAESTSYQAMQDYLKRTGRSRTFPEGEVIASYDLSTGNIKHNGLILDVLMQGLVEPDYASITAPALALYATPSSPAALMEAWYDPNDSGLQDRLDELFHIGKARRDAEMKRFDTEVKNSRVIGLADADHWVFLSHEAEVLQAMREFIDSLSR